MSKKKIVRYIIILLVIVTSALCFLFFYIPYYNRLQFEYGERKKVLHDIEKVDSIVNNYHRFFLSFYEDEHGGFLYSKLGVVFRENITDSLVVLRFAEKSFYDNYNPLEWSWSYLPNNNGSIENSYFYWYIFKRKKHFHTAKDTLDFIYDIKDREGLDIKRSFRIENLKYGSRHNKLSIDFKDLKKYVKSIERNEVYCGGSYVGPFTNDKLGGKKSVFFLKNGDVFVGEFKDNHFYRGEYLYRYGLDDSQYKDYNSYYFVGTFVNDRPYRGRWYNRFGKRLH